MKSDKPNDSSADHPADLTIDDSHFAQLSAKDADAIDALFANGFDAADHTQDRSDHQGRAANLLGLLNHYPVPTPPANLARRTAAFVRQSEARDRRSMQIQEHAAPMGTPFRWSELIAVAAIFLVGASVVWPVLERTRADARQVACRANLHDAAVAFTSYAAEHNGRLPRGLVRPDSPWYQVGHHEDSDGSVRSNTANLFLLARGGYVNPDKLNCPENENALDNLSATRHDWPTPKAVSYSYQNQYGEGPIIIEDAPRMVLLADKNPQFQITPDEFTFLDLDDSTNSHMHDGKGQNILRADCAVLWTESPVLPNGDVIYKAQGIDRYTGTETPSSKDDVFIVP